MDLIRFFIPGKDISSPEKIFHPRKSKFYPPKKFFIPKVLRDENFYPGIKYSNSRVNGGVSVSVRFFKANFLNKDYLKINYIIVFKECLVPIKSFLCKSPFNLFPKPKNEL